MGMKTTKEFSNVPNRYYRPEFDHCLACGSALERSHTAWNKTIIRLDGTVRVFNQAYRCCDRENCSHPKRVYQSGYADGLSLSYYTYGLDVIVYIGQQRLREKRTIPEIHQALCKREKPIPISEREVQYLFDVYLTLSACSHGERLEKYRPRIEANGGIVLAIDGAKPEKGQPGLYIFRDTLSGCRLHSALLPSADTDSLTRELQVVKNLGLKVQAVISDDEYATVAAVSHIYPDVPHGLCHTHFLKAVQKPIYAQDQELAKELKKPLRPLTQVERFVQNHPEEMAELSISQQKALRRYLDAVRGVLMRKGQAPFQLAGTTIYDDLVQLTGSFARSQEEQNHWVLKQLQGMSETYLAHQTPYERVQRQQAWFSGLADLLNVPETETHHWSTQSGVEVAQAIADYLEILEDLGDEVSEDQPYFRYLRSRIDHWAPGLFWTYDFSALPRTNNALEAEIGDIKEQYRRITGRRSLKDYFMRYGPYLTFDDDQDDPEELLAWFQNVDRQAFLNERAKLDALREQLRNMQRFRKDPDDFLAETERLWADSD
jgi:hypothetical protein